MSADPAIPPRMQANRICVVPNVAGVGGMVTFKYKLLEGLAKRGISASQDLNDTPYQSVLIIGGARQLWGLWRARQRGTRLVQRLNGMNWLHRLSSPEYPKASLRHKLRAESGNVLLSFIRARLAHEIVYQSQFSQTWWERVYGPTHVAKRVVYNGVDLQAYSPDGTGKPPSDRWRILLVEGSLMGGYEAGLAAAVGLAERLADGQPGLPARPVELMVVGRVSPAVQQSWKNKTRLQIHWVGQVEHQCIPEIDRSAHLLYSSDINAACPNSVIEALACGLPVAAFDTGALPELVAGDAGRVASYGGDSWKLDPPDLDGLARQAAEILADQEYFRLQARRRAEAMFGLDAMVEGYLAALLEAYDR